MIWLELLNWASSSDSLLTLYHSNPWPFTLTWVLTLCLDHPRANNNTVQHTTKDFLQHSSCPINFSHKNTTWLFVSFYSDVVRLCKPLLWFFRPHHIIVFVVLVRCLFSVSRLIWNLKCCRCIICAALCCLGCGWCGSVPGIHCLGR